MSFGDLFDKFLCSPVKRSLYTHVKLNGGTLMVPPNEIDCFYATYIEHFKKKQKLHIAERPLHNVSILKTDFDFTFNDERVLAEDDINHIHKIYIETIKHFFNTETFMVYIMEKEEKKPSKKKGLHVICPNIVLTHTMEYIFRLELIKKFDSFFNDVMGTKNKPDDIIDAAIVKNCWLMYGSNKPSDTDYYHVTKIINQDGHSVTNEGDEEQYIRLFSIRSKGERELTAINDVVKDYVNEYERITQENNRKKEDSKLMNDSTCPYLTPQTMTNDTYYSLANILVEKVLSTERARHYKSWIELGICLYNIDHRLLETWEMFSKRVSDKYKSGECARKWRTMKVFSFQMEKLKQWAEVDNPDEYHKVMNSRVYDLVMNSIVMSKQRCSFPDFNIAILCKFILANRIVSVTMNKATNWWYFENHRWHVDTKDNKIIHLIRSEVIPVIDSIKRQIRQQKYENENNDVLTEQLQSSEHATQQLSNHLKNYQPVRRVVAECVVLFEDKDFMEKLESKQHLLCFTNGVYDLEEDKFRDGLPEDYCYQCTHIPYIGFHPEDPVYKEIQYYLETVFVEYDVRDYMLKLLASFLNGNVTDEKFYFWTGSGSNSKSKFVSLYQKCLGDYSMTIPTTLLTEKQGKASEANSALASIRNKRFTPMNESPDPKSQVQIGLLKQLTGGDTVSTRDVFQSQYQFKTHMRMVYIANKIPGFTETDFATWRRIRNIIFRSTFVDAKDYNGQPRHFIKDPALEHSKMPKWPPYFMALLLHYYKIYKEEGLQEPEDVVNTSKQLELRSNTAKNYVLNFLKKSDNEFDVLHISTVYDNYYEVLQFYSLQNTKVSKAVLLELIKNEYQVDTFGPENSKSFKNLKFVSDDNDDNSKPEPKTEN